LLAEYPSPPVGGLGMKANVRKSLGGADTLH